MPSTSRSSSSIARRLGLGFGTVLALLLTVAVVSGLGLRSMASQLEQITEVNASKIRLARDLMGNINELALHVRNVTLFTDMQKIDAEVKQVAEAQSRYAQTQSRLVAAMATDEEKAALQEIVKASLRALPSIDQAVTQGSSGDSTAAVSTLTGKMQEEEAQWRQKVALLVDLQDQLSLDASTLAKTQQRHTLATMLVLVVVSLALGGLISWRITRSVTTPVQRAMVVAERIADCDLTSAVEVHATDETGRLLEAIRTMQDRMKSLVGEISQSAESIQTASAEVAMGTQDLSLRTEHTSSNLQQAASSMAELTDTVRQSVDAAHNAHQLATSAAGLAARGGAVVLRVVSTMEDINTSSRKISDITSVIDGIAFQTNILALNAAVEAARAGEQGRGFAVVASEVRNLAGRAAEAAREIKGLIAASVDKVQAGTTLVGDAGHAMQDIVDSVQKVSLIIGEISASSSAQSDGIERVNGAVAQLDQMTQQNAALVEQSAAAAESLKEQAGNLTRMVGLFKLGTVADSPRALQMLPMRA
nr:methyl-accepting chemotaxis protein [uncultured Albidiferax sp.]